MSLLSIICRQCQGFRRNAVLLRLGAEGRDEGFEVGGGHVFAFLSKDMDAWAAGKRQKSGEKVRKLGKILVFKLLVLYLH